MAVKHAVEAAGIGVRRLSARRQHRPNAARWCKKLKSRRNVREERCVWRLHVLVQHDVRVFHVRFHARAPESKTGQEQGIRGGRGGAFFIAHLLLLGKGLLWGRRP